MPAIIVEGRAAIGFQPVWQFRQRILWLRSGNMQDSAMKIKHFNPGIGHGKDGPEGSGSLLEFASASALSKAAVKRGEGDDHRRRRAGVVTAGRTRVGHPRTNTWSRTRPPRTRSGGRTSKAISPEHFDHLKRRFSRAGEASRISSCRISTPARMPITGCQRQGDVRIWHGMRCSSAI